MLEGLAVWALFIYLLRLVGMPWNKYSKGFAYIGGSGWLLFVWVGLINYTPMDLSGGSVVQSPHIQLRPDSTNVKGKVDNIYIEPNQSLTKGQPVYKIDPTAFKIALNKAKVQLSSAQTELESAKQQVAIAKATYQTSKQDIHTVESRVDSAIADLRLQEKTLNRYEEQNRVVEHTITENDIDKQRTAVQLAQDNLKTLESELVTKKLNSEKAWLSIDSARLNAQRMNASVDSARENVKQAEWDLKSTLVYAPTDGFVTNFILREGQRVSALPRLQMYTNEKYVLMRVNHQAIRNVKPGQAAEFASAVYPGKVFAAEVEGIIEATGEAQATLMGFDESVRVTTGKNLQNKHHFVRLKIEEPEGYDIPVGSVGLAWISGEKPVGFMSFLDAIRGIILRMKSQLYYFYSI